MSDFPDNKLFEATEWMRNIAPLDQQRETGGKVATSPAAQG